MTPVEQIKSRLSTADVVGSYIKIVRAGANLKGVCPFHAEKSPSFFVSPARDSWHCFGCGKGGDQFSFVMDMEGVDFKEALEILARKAGVELRTENPKERSERARLFSLLEEAAAWYTGNLAHYPEVVTYLRKRGVAQETIASFQIGYALPVSNGWRAFTEQAIKKGYTPDELIKAGLAIKKGEQNGSASATSLYDRFRNRIMFPIADYNSRIIGFGGRIFPMESGSVSNGEREPAKYINSPQTILYDKSRVLYAFDKAKGAMRKENNCILVEGYMDAIMAHQAGTAYTVAVSGTALTEYQLQALKRLSERISTAFDMDEAGESATRRSIDLALEMGFDVRAITIPGSKDPADLIAEDVSVWTTQVEAADTIVSFFLQKALAKHDPETIGGKQGISKSVLPLIARIPQHVEKAHWVSVVASRLGVREDAVWADLQNIKNTPQTHTSKAEEKETVVPAYRGRAQLLEERLLGMLLAYGLAVPVDVTEDLFSTESARVILRSYRQQKDSKASLESLDPELRSMANKYMLETELAVAKENAPEEVTSCMEALRREALKKHLEKIEGDIRRAEGAGNTQQVSVLIQEFTALSKQLTSL